MKYKNYASDSQFIITFTFKNEEFRFFLQSTMLPSFDFGEMSVIKNGKTLALPGSSKNHNTVPLSFLVDEEYFVYTDLLDIQEQIKNKGESVDNMILTLQNNQNIPVLKIEFNDIFFTSIMGPTVDTKSQQTEIYMDVTMAFKDVKFIR